MDVLRPFEPVHLIDPIDAEEFQAGLVEKLTALQSVHPDDARGTVCQRAKAGFTVAQAPVGFVAFAQQTGFFFGEGRKAIPLTSQLFALSVEIEKDRRLTAEDMGLDRFVEKVDRPGLITAELMQIVLWFPREKDNRHVLGAP